MGSGVKATTNLGEQQAVAETNQQLGLLSQGAELQNQQLAQGQEAQQSQFNQQSQALNQERQAIQLRNQLQTREILNNLKREKGNLDQKQYESQLDQVAQDVRLNTKRYVDNLQREGSRARLNDELSFKEELTKSQFGDSSALLKKQLGNKSVLDASDREYNEALAKMGVSDAYDIFNKELAAQKQGMMWSAVGGLAQAGIGAGTQYAQGQAVKAEDKRKAQYYQGAGSEEKSYEADKYRNMKFEE